MDLEGFVISTWLIKNPHYSQMAGRHELFEQERHNEPVPGWHICGLARKLLSFAG